MTRRLATHVATTLALAALLLGARLALAAHVYDHEPAAGPETCEICLLAAHAGDGSLAEVPCATPACHSGSRPAPVACSAPVPPPADIRARGPPTPCR